MPANCLDPQNPACLAQLRAAANDFYQPANPQERFAVERIALAQLSLLRAAGLEEQVFANPAESVPSPKLLSLVLRYHAQADRQYRRAIADFERLRDLRTESQPESEAGAGLKSQLAAELARAPKPCPVNPVPPRQTPAARSSVGAGAR